MKLRDYQQRCLEAIGQQLHEGHRTLAVLPTGAGKTVIFGHVARTWNQGRVLIMAHRDELIQQAAEKVGRITGEPCDIEMGDSYADSGSLHGQARVVVTSVQTMCRPRRQARFDPQQFGLLVVDEAHHAPAQTYRSVIDYFGQNPYLHVLGVTATPDRADEEALGQVFESVAFEYKLTDAIDDGWLVPIEQQFVFVEGLDFSSVRTTAGDLNGADLARLMEAEEMLHKVVSPTIQLAGDQQTLVFASSVSHADKMAEICNRHRSGCAEFVHGGTDRDVRRDMLRRYARREFQFLFNCAVTTEGFDEPAIGVVAIAKPTKSRALYSQCVGRGTRTLPGVTDGITDAASRKAAIAASGKSSVLILDYVGNSGRHKLVSAADILGGDYGDDAVEAAKTAAAKKSAKGEKVDIREEIERAQDNIEEEAKRKRKHVVATARFGTKSVNPFDVLDVSPQREPGWFKGKPPSERMSQMLEKNGVDTAKLSYWDAKQLIGAICQRREKGLCSLKQAKLLTKHGYSQDVTFEAAGQIIDGLAKNGWKRPD